MTFEGNLGSYSVQCEKGMGQRMNKRNTITLQVVSKGGVHELIHLTPPLKVTLPSKEGGMGCISCSDGIDHFFTSEGIYDGWGITLDTPTPDADGWVGDYIQAVQESRQASFEDKQNQYKGA